MLVGGNELMADYRSRPLGQDSLSAAWTKMITTKRAKRQPAGIDLDHILPYSLRHTTAPHCCPPRYISPPSRHPWITPAGLPRNNTSTHSQPSSTPQTRCRIKARDSTEMSLLVRTVQSIRPGQGQ